ncbi:O-antigen ligase [Desulfobotulus alkaliphilus]|uniref:O-antigen ligase n=2 Tax=Desulfobotulus alkaliphilus TaxID=622671 RepID=A0A562RIN2_9BACT|nr:O-antigen ligase [Desulfobotulus alkaliphilus]
MAVFRMNFIKMSRFNEHALLFLITGFLVLIPFGRLSEIPLLLMAIYGVFVLSGKGRQLIPREQLILFSIIFLAFWIPILFSLYGSVNSERTFRVALTFLRLYFSGILVLYAFCFPGMADRVLKWCAFILVIWVGDGLFQAVWGYNLTGNPLGTIGGQVTGFFGNSTHMGSFLGVLSALLLVYSRLKWALVWQFLVFAATAAVVLMGGSRMGWLGFAFVVTGLSLWILARGGRKVWPRFVLIIVCVSVVFSGAFVFSQAVSTRVTQSLFLFSKDRELADMALSGRLTLWSTTIEVIKANPLNGVGARNLRDAYSSYADPHDRFVDRAYHAHNIILDIASETGIIGIIGYIIAMICMLRVWVRANSYEKERLLPYALALFAVFFPLNTHYATYSAAWSTTYFWLISLFCAAAAKSGFALPDGMTSHEAGETVRI